MLLASQISLFYSKNMHLNNNYIDIVGKKFPTYFTLLCSVRIKISIYVSTKLGA
jgi:hypothetical protein